jgi:hypothetical protein
MAYAIHIRREAAPISLAEWQVVAARQQGVRLSDGDLVVVNPVTGEEIRFPNNGGDADLWYPDTKEWARTFRWGEERGISFRPPDDFLDPKSHLRSVARALAGELEASVVGDEGERYE